MVKVLSTFLVYLEELGQVREAHDFPGLELVPNIHGKYLSILCCIVHQRTGVQPARVRPGNVGPGKVLLVLNLIDHDTPQLLFQLEVCIV